MQFTQAVAGLIQFMEMTEQQVTQKFLTIDTAQRLDYSNPLTPIVFIPGTRKDRVLLVAHYDTIPGDGVKCQLDGTIISSALGNKGIGADDRAGVFALWLCRKLGHSLLLVPDEEVGCLGSDYVTKKYPHILKDHQFMIEFDRQDDYDLVYYDMETDAFEEYIEEAYYGYSKAQGIFTDICELVPSAGICGLNVSVGYKNQHTSREFIEVFSFMRTMELTKQLLTRPEIPKFECDAINYGRSDSSRWYYGRWWGEDEGDNSDEAPFVNDTNKKKNIVDDAVAIRGNITQSMLTYVDFIQCPHCSAIHDPDEGNVWVFDEPYCLCGSCNREFDLSGNCYVYPDYPNILDHYDDLRYEAGNS